MSIKVMSAVWEHSRQKGSKLLLLLAIADFARDDGIAWPSIRSLAEMSRMSERQTSRNLRDLIKAGELEVIKHGGSGARDTSKYRVITNPNKGDKLSVDGAKKGDKMTPLQSDKYDVGDTLKGDISGHKGDTAMSYDPLIEPSLEPSSIPPDGGSPPEPTDQPFPMLERVLEPQGTTPAVLTRQILGRQLAVAKRLIADGVTIDEVGECTTWLLKQNWVDTVDMFMIEKKLGDFRISKARSESGTIRPGSGESTVRRGMSAKEALGKYYEGND